MVQKLRLELNETERKALEVQRDHHKQAQVRERCAALLKIASGQSAHEVARHGLLKARDPDTVYGWLRLYKSEGIEGVVKRLHGGNHRSFRQTKGSGRRTPAASTRADSKPLDVEADRGSI